MFSYYQKCEVCTSVRSSSEHSFEWWEMAKVSKCYEFPCLFPCSMFNFLHPYLGKIVFLWIEEDFDLWGCAFIMWFWRPGVSLMLKFLCGLLFLGSKMGELTQRRIWYVFGILCRPCYNCWSSSRRGHVLNSSRALSHTCYVSAQHSHAHILACSLACFCTSKYSSVC